MNNKVQAKFFWSMLSTKYISFVWAGDEYVIDEVNNSIVISQH